MKNRLLKTLKPLLGEWGRKRLPKIYKIYEILYWKIVINRRKKGLQSIGYEYLPKIEESLNKRGIECFLAYGTLLGIVREGKFIGHDDDIDLGIIKNSNFSWAKVEDALNEVGMTKKHQFKSEGHITEQTYRYKNLSVDLFMFDSDDDKSYAYVYFQEQGREYEKNQFSIRCPKVSKIERTKIYECPSGVFRVPENEELFLEEVYGKNWRIPDPNFVSLARVIENKFGYQEKFE